MRRVNCFALIFVSLFSVMPVAPAKGDVMISYGTLEDGIRYIDLIENQSGQFIDFFVIGNTQVDGFEFNLQILDGGAIVGGTATGPVLGTIDLLTGTIFSSASPTQVDVVDSPLAKQSTVDTTSLVLANGRIGSVEFDTTGFGPGLYAFSLTVEAPAGTFPTTFYSGTSVVGTTAPSGFLRVLPIPEPGSPLLLTSIACWFWGRRRDRTD